MIDEMYYHDQHQSMRQGDTVEKKEKYKKMEDNVFWKIRPLSSNEAQDNSLY